ncbi:hypothetical protein BC826DRAFT_1068212 [Russula brevipes]|nr:hypothetical protein BC826DRAFT_1068212 [Russula brevipes]
MAHLSRFRRLLVHLIALHPPPPSIMSPEAVFFSKRTSHGRQRSALQPLAPHGPLPYPLADRIIVASRHWFVL